MTRQQSLLVTALVALLLGYGFYALALKPKRSELDSVGKQLTEQQDQLAQARALLESNTAAKATYERDYATVVRLGKAVPSDDDMQSLVVQLSAAARSAGIDFSTLSVAAAAAGEATTGSATQLPPGATVGTAGFPQMPFTFTFTGEFFRLSKFFSRLDDFIRVDGARIAVRGRLLTVNSIKLEPDTAGFPAIKATVDATSYLTSPLESVTAASAAAAAAGSGPATTDPSAASADTTTTASTTGAAQ